MGFAFKQCTGCGAVAEFPERGISTQCAYCDSPLVDTEAAMGLIHRVAPFRIKRSVAVQKLKEHLDGHFWAPNEIKKGILNEHKLRAVLVPFWAHFGTARSEYSAKVGIWWYKTVTYVDSKGRVRTRQEKRTEWFAHEGTAICPVNGQLASASIGLPEADSNELEPFDLGRAMPFEARFLAGWEAEVPSVSEAQSDRIVRSEVADLEARRIAQQLLPGDEGKVESVSTDIQLDKVEIILLPVWMASWRHGDTIHRQMVNGQTGKVIGDVPTSTQKILTAVLLGALICLLAYWGMSQ
jgi:hypothetical protein